MRIVVIGCGLISHAIVLDLAKSKEVNEIIIGDVDERRRIDLLEKIKSDKVTQKHIDVTDQQATIKEIKNSDVVISALPYRISILASRAAVSAGVSLVDCSYVQEQWDLDKQARKAGTIIMPDCGVAPGLSNILVGHAVSQMNEVDYAEIICGGIPQKPISPLDYRIVFSTEGVVDLLCGKVPIIRNGKITNIDALSGLRIVDFPGIGNLEVFFTDGLSTLLHTMKNKIKNLEEKTARWPGHVEKIQTMKDVGFFDMDSIEVDGAKVIPRNVTIKLFDKYLRLEDTKDLTVLRVQVNGKKNGRIVEYSYFMLDFFDEKHRMTSMARTTGFTAGIISRMIGRGDIKETGVVPAEIAITEDRFDTFFAELSKKGIKVNATYKCEFPILGQEIEVHRWKIH